MKVEVRESTQHGRGVFARVLLKRGEVILQFKGPQLTRTQLTPEMYHLQIGEDAYLGPSGEADDYVNHSCEPNAGFDHNLKLVALRDIAVGEEITWDYSTAIDEEDFTGFPCGCGAARCRGLVRSFRHLDRNEQERLVASVLPYLRHKYFAP